MDHDLQWYITFNQRVVCFLSPNFYENANNELNFIFTNLEIVSYQNHLFIKTIDI